LAQLPSREPVALPLPAFKPITVITSQPIAVPALAIGS
jgi:hypothetical protein